MSSKTDPLKENGPDSLSLCQRRLCSGIFTPECIYVSPTRGSMKQGLNDSRAVITFTCKSTCQLLTGDFAGCVVSQAEPASGEDFSFIVPSSEIQCYKDTP